ncbi:MAG: nuclear transport factor 2 family protein [Cyanobacteria bacterium P01_D01_bin.128]
MKTTVQKNLSLLARFEKFLPHDLASAQDLVADSFVWHYFNPFLPEVAGDYTGLDGLQAFFQKLSVLTQNTFRVETSQVIPVGEELVVIHAVPSMTFADKAVELDAVVVWRIVGDRIVEAWDIPAVYTERSPKDHSNQMQGAA